MANKLELSEIEDRNLKYSPPGEAPKTGFSSFFRGPDCNFNPYAQDLEKPDFLEHFVLRGHLPSQPLIKKGTKVTAFGSCFAGNITEHLAALGFDLSKQRAPDIFISSIGEGLANVYAVLSQFEWALEGHIPPDNLWHGERARQFTPSEEVRQKTADVFRNTEVFIITIGVSEVWYDEVSGGVFWRAVPLEHYDPARHKFRVCSHAETLAALARIQSIIQRHCRADIIFTLSPVPLMATFRNQSCITANSASKAILRSAFDEFFRTLSDTSRCHYFPAYELVTEMFSSRFAKDGRHPHAFIIEAIMKVFEAFYCETQLTRAEAETAFHAARSMSADVSAEAGSSPKNLALYQTAFLDAVAYQKQLFAEKLAADQSLAEARAEIAALKAKLRE